jgi:two-component sensor histidine kinase
MKSFLSAFFLSLALMSNGADKDVLLSYILALDFSRAEQEADQVDEKFDSQFSLLVQLLKHNGQYPDVDSKIREKVELNPLPSNLEKLILGTYYLLNVPANSRSFELIHDAIVESKRTDKVDITMKLAYLMMLKLYENEIVQGNDEYLSFLNEYKEIANSNYEIAWFHIHNLRYITKIVKIEEASKLLKPSYLNMKDHFENNSISDNVNSYFYLISGVYYRFYEEFDLARSSYYKAIEISQNQPFLQYISFTGNIQMSRIESANGNFDQSRFHLNEAKKYWNASDLLRSEFIQSRWSSINYYAIIGQYDSAYESLFNSIVLEHSLDYRKNTLKISELNVRLETAEKENEILTQKNQIQMQTTWLWTIALFSVVLIGLMVVLIFTFRKIRHKNRRIQTLMRELHHRVKNNLQVVSSLLGLQSMKLKDPVARKAVSEGKDRLRAMSLIHQKLYQNEDAISLNIKEYISNLVTELAQSYGYQNKTRFILDIPSIELDADNTLPLGLIVNELVSNTFKYAFKHVDEPELEIKLLQEGEKDFSFLLRDNGPGFPDGFDIDQANSFGTKLVSILVKQLNGTMTINQENGLTYRINFHFK